MSFKQLSIGCATAGALVLLAGCGSSGSPDTGAAKSGTGGKSTPTASPSPTITPATEAQLRKIVLQATDLPGWKGSPADPDSSKSNDELTRCVGAMSTDADQVANADSDNFDFDDAEISSSATSYKSPSDLDTDVAVLKSPKFVPCATQDLKKELATSVPKGTSLGTPTLKFTPGPGTGPANVVGSGSATIPILGSAGQVTVYMDFVYLTGSLIEAEVDAENIGSPVPAAMLQSAIKAVSGRLANG